MARLNRFRRCAAIVVIGAYLLLTVFYLGRHALGDSASGPLAYCFTWDMFPNYPTESSRRWAIGETASGKYVKLVPNDRQRFRWGVDDDITRFDIDRRLPFLRAAAAEAVRDYNATAKGDPIRHVYLAETYWPQKYNLPQPLSRQFYWDKVIDSTYWATPTSEESRPHPTYWRLIDEVAVDEEGGAAGWELSL